MFEQLRDLAQAEGAGSLLLHVGRRAGALVLTIEHPDGVTIDHCADISRATSAFLDGIDYGKQRYVLEVGSPGLDREFYTTEDYLRFVGEPIKTTFRSGGKKVTVKGSLEAFDPSTETISLLPTGDSKESTSIEADSLLRIALRDIITTRLEPQF